MALELIISAVYQKQGSVLKISLNGTYGFAEALRPTFDCSVSISLVRLLRIETTGPVFVTSPVDFDKKIIINKNGSICRPISDQPLVNTSPVIISGRIPNDSFIRAEVIVSVFKGKKLKATKSVFLGPSNA
jgi:hypothetical protein